MCLRRIKNKIKSISLSTYHVLIAAGIGSAVVGMNLIAYSSKYFCTSIYFGLILTGGMLMLTGLWNYAEKNLEKLKGKDDELSKLERNAIISLYRNVLTLALGTIYLLTILGLIGWIIPMLEKIPVNETSKTILSLAAAILSILPGIKTLVKGE